MSNSAEPKPQGGEVPYRVLLNLLEDLNSEKEELLKQRQATLNLLEDLDEEKRSVEKKVVERTQELASAKAQDEAMLTSIGEGVLAINLNEKIILINKAAERMLGVFAQEVVGKSWPEVIEVVDEKGTMVPVQQRPFALARSSTADAIATKDYYYVRKDKTRFPVAITSAPIFGQNVEGVIVVFRDISEEKAIDRAKSEFVSLAAHQLNTPLTAIRGYTEMLIDEASAKLTQDQGEYLREVHQATVRMIDLVKAFLNISRIELGVLAVDPEPTNIIELARETRSELSLQIKEKMLIFTEEFDNEIPILNVDPNLVKIVFQNLLSNAVKYTPASGAVTFRLKRELPNILIAVSDTGLGIPQSQQSQIFTKLFRADNVRGVIREGTGLGLYLVKQIVEESGGKVWFESEENKGTTFYATIPLGGMKKKEGSRRLQ